MAVPVEQELLNCPAPPKRPNIPAAESDRKVSFDRPSRGGTFRKPLVP